MTSREPAGSQGTISGNGQWFDNSLCSLRVHEHGAHLLKDCVRKLDIAVDSVSQAYGGLVVSMEIRSACGNEIESTAQFEVESRLRGSMITVVNLEALHSAIGQAADQLC